MFTIELPKSRIEWEARKLEWRSKLWVALGEMPPLFLPEIQVTAREVKAGYTEERFTFTNGLGHTVYGCLLIPQNLQTPTPAVLYLHNHGGNYDAGKSEILRPWPMDTMDTPPGIALVQAGFVVMAIDAYAFEERQNQGPGGINESGRDTENALFKQFLWEGRSLWGMMLHDDLLALNALCARADVDPGRIAVTGSSMGGSRATWLAALDDRIRMVIPVIQMTRYQDFIAQGRMNGHSFYYYVPGILKQGLDMEILTALAAPRPQCVLVGDSDPLSPIEGVKKIDAFTRGVYGLYDDTPYQTVIYAGVGHQYTPEMFAAMMDFLKHL